MSVLVLAALLRFAGLDRQLWLDEIDALVLSQRRPASAIVSDWPPGTSGVSGAAHVFYDLLAHLSRGLLGEGPAAVRLPAALFGVAAVGALFGLVRQRFSVREALAAALLLAASVPHVFQSQNARGYTTLFGLAVVSSWLLLRMKGREHPPAAEVLGYVLSTALAAWSVPLGVFLLGGHVLALGVVYGSPGGRGSWPWRAVALALAGSALLIVLLYSPLMARTVEVAAEQGRLPTPGAGALYRLGVVRTGLTGLAQSSGGPLGLGLLLLVGGAGLLRWGKADPASLAALGLPVVLQGAVLLALDVPLNPRYFILALAPLVVSVALGLLSLREGLARRWPAAAPVVHVTLLALAVLASGPGFARYYRVPKQDFLGAIEHARALATPEDRLVAVDHAGRVIRGYYGAGFADVQTLDALLELEAQGQRIVLVATLERFLAVRSPALHRHIQAHYRALATLDATVAGGEMTLYERAPADGSLNRP